MKTKSTWNRFSGSERREAKRFRLSDPLRWRTLRGDAPRDARITDVSENSFAFVTHPHDALQRGTTVWLSSGPDAGTQHRISQVRHRGNLELVVMCPPENREDSNVG